MVVDTNVVLDLWVFFDPRVSAVAGAARSAAWRWIATPAMREELRLVLAYAHIAARLGLQDRSAAEVLALYDARVQQLEAAPRSSAICKDPDDQKFIDLAVQQGAVLLSKDKAVLALRKRMALLGASACTVQEFSA
jgi:putative PIN family toxin of toxin-antitoxin system